MKPLVEIDRGQCRFPVDTTAQGQHLFCAEAVAPNPAAAPLCGKHYRMAYSRPVRPSERAGVDLEMERETQ